MEYPKISIVTASYNQANYLEHTIKSIVEQGYPNLEYIIIDGGSTDGSIEIIKKYEQYISYWVSEKDGGVCDAINKGFKVSTGDIMGCLNSDDMLHSRSLFSIAEIFTNFSQISWLVGACTVYDEVGRTVFIMPSINCNIYHYLLGFRDFLQLESTYWRRSLWLQAGGYFDNELKLASDFELWTRFFKNSELYIVDALVGGFRYRKGSQLSVDNKDKYLAEIDIVLKRQLDDNSINSNLQKYHELRKSAEPFSGNKVFRKLFRKRVSRFENFKNQLLARNKKVIFNYKDQRFGL